MLCGFTVLFGICKYVTINIVLDKSKPQTTFVKKKQTPVPGPSYEICKGKFLIRDGKKMHTPDVS